MQAQGPFENSKSFFAQVSKLAETTNEDTLVKKLDEAVQKYNDAKLFNYSDKIVNSFYTEIKVLSYIIILKTLSTSTEQLIKDMEKINRISNLIFPPLN